MKNCIHVPPSPTTLVLTHEYVFDRVGDALFKFFLFTRLEVQSKCEVSFVSPLNNSIITPRRARNVAPHPAWHSFPEVKQFGWTNDDI